jgi:hypothetical protein
VTGYRGAANVKQYTVGTVERLDQGGLTNIDSVNIKTNYTTSYSGQLREVPSFLTSKAMMLLSLNKLLRL